MKDINKIDYNCLAKPFEAKMLTTIDNPFNPFTQFDEWFQFDITNNYNTCALIARFVDDSRNITDAEYNDSIDRAIATILKMDVIDQYKVVTSIITPQFIQSEEEALKM